MMKPESVQPHATTTEELIVQYLDGELVRNELETVLFERLATSEEARMLLREHLVLRGAIRNTYESANFELSADLDARTRDRIQQMLEAFENKPMDAEPIQTNAVARRMKRWSLRPTVAVLGLLVAIGATWFLTRSTTDNTKPSIAQAVTNNGAKVTQQDASMAISFSGEASKPAEIIRVIKVPVKSNEVTPSYAQNTAVQSVQQTSAPQEKPAEVPADIMISRRYSKMINAAAKHEVVVTSRDRL